MFLIYLQYIFTKKKKRETPFAALPVVSSERSHISFYPPDYLQASPQFPAALQAVCSRDSQTTHSHKSSLVLLRDLLSSRSINRKIKVTKKQRYKRKSIGINGKAMTGYLRKKK